MVTATIGLALFLLVTVSSITIARRRLRYEHWYWVHLTAYAGDRARVVPPDPDRRRHQPRLPRRRHHVLARALLRQRRAARVPRADTVWSAFRYRLRVADVVAEGPDVTSVTITGRGLGRLRARPGQFFLWRFLARGFWWTSHPFSLSAAPDGRSLRISVKAAGDHTRRLRSLPVGTRVVAEGPYGAFTGAARHGRKSLLIAGGIGITPVRALAETLDGDVHVIYRVLREEDVVLRGRARPCSRSAAASACATSSATTSSRGGARPPHGRAPARARARPARAGRVPVRAAGHGRGDREGRPAGRRAAARAPRRALRLLTRCGKPRIYWTFRSRTG